MKKLGSFIVVIAIFLVGVWFLDKNPQIKGRLPVPTEFVEKKSKRKEFKQQRKEYMQQMHRAHPDDDWKKMDAETRKIRTDKVQNLRKSLITSGNWNPENKQIENISRDISGYWQERGSNNLAGFNQYIDFI